MRTAAGFAVPRRFVISDCPGSMFAASPERVSHQEHTPMTLASIVRAKSPPRKTSLPFAALPHDLRKDPALRGHDKAKLLAAALLEYARDKPSCFPSNRRLAEDLGCSPRTVQLALAALQRAGWIRVEQGGDGRRIWLTWREAD